MKNAQCAMCLFLTRSKLRSMVTWLLALFLMALFSLLFIMSFIHFLKMSNNHLHHHQIQPPIIVTSSEPQDHSTTRSIYFLLSCYFLLWTVVHFGGILYAFIPATSSLSSSYNSSQEDEDEDDAIPSRGGRRGSRRYFHHGKPGRILLMVLLIVLAIMTLLLITIDRVYNPWILNFLQGKIFCFCLQVSAATTAAAGLCYVGAICGSVCSLCPTRNSPGSGRDPSHTIMMSNNNNNNNERGGGEEGVVIRDNDKWGKTSFVNPCYQLEFVLLDGSTRAVIPAKSRGCGQGLTQV